MILTVKDQVGDCNGRCIARIRLTDSTNISTCGGIHQFVVTCIVTVERNAGGVDLRGSHVHAVVSEGSGCSHIIIAERCHNGTLTNRAASALAMIREIGRDNVRTHWQPSQFLTHEENCEGLSLLLPYIDCVHVFAWEGANSQRFLLSEHHDRWADYLSILKGAEQDIHLLMEFTPQNDPAEFPTEAQTLHAWLS